MPTRPAGRGTSSRSPEDVRYAWIRSDRHAQALVDRLIHVVEEIDAVRDPVHGHRGLVVGELERPDGGLEDRRPPQPRGPGGGGSGGTGGRIPRRPAWRRVWRNGARSPNMLRAPWGAPDPPPRPVACAGAVALPPRRTHWRPISGSGGWVPPRQGSPEAQPRVTSRVLPGVVPKAPSVQAKGAVPGPSAGHAGAGNACLVLTGARTREKICGHQVARQRPAATGAGRRLPARWPISSPPAGLIDPGPRAARTRNRADLPRPLIAPGSPPLDSNLAGNPSPRPHSRFTTMALDLSTDSRVSVELFLRRVRS